MFESVDISPLQHGKVSGWRAVREAPGNFLLQCVCGSILVLAGLGFLFGSVTNWITVFLGARFSGESVTTGDRVGAIVPGVMLLVFAGVAIGAGSYLVARFFSGSFASALMRQFAERNGWRYQHQHAGARHHATVFLVPADQRSHRDVVTGASGGHVLEFGDFLATDKHRSSKSTTNRTETVVSFGYLAVNLVAGGPNFILDSRRNGPLQRGFLGHSRYDLEGDFPEHFTAWAPEGTERDMLEMLTPDLMAVFSDYGQDFDFEVCGNLLVIVANRRSVTKAATVTGLLAVADRIVPSVNVKAQQGSW